MMKIKSTNWLVDVLSCVTVSLVVIQLNTSFMNVAIDI